MNNLFEQRVTINGKTRVPVWFMRQAGRYHSHYQNIRKDHSFMEMCKTPELASEITMGPIDDFGFDAAILFSDLLFPLEEIGLGLSYDSGPPTLDLLLKHLDDFKKMNPITSENSFYQFQKLATEQLRKKLPESKSLLGFVGSPFTLFTYAVEGSHKGPLIDTKKGLYDQRYREFSELLRPIILDSMIQQAEGGADAVCIFDTAAGELSARDFERFVVPEILSIVESFKAQFPKIKIIYYSKYTHLHYLSALNQSKIDVFGLDWRNDLIEAAKYLAPKHYIQGNIDPIWLHLSPEHLRENLEHYRDTLLRGDLPLDRWIFGLGHGVTIKTPEENVRSTVQFVHDHFQY
jgi:uroporphyrinogen decarboxylase